VIDRRTRNRLRAAGATDSVMRGLLIMADIGNYTSVRKILCTLSTDLDVIAARRWVGAIQPERKEAAC
jgi:hypothetical protein